MRYLPLTPADHTSMLATIGAASIDALFVDVPAAARRDGLVALPVHQGELEVERANVRRQRDGVVSSLGARIAERDDKLAALQSERALERRDAIVELLGKAANAQHRAPRPAS